MSIRRALRKIAADAWACRSPAAQAKRERERAYEALVGVLTRQGSMGATKADNSKGK